VPLSWNLGTITSLKPLGYSRSVMGLLYLLPCKVKGKFNLKCTYIHAFNYMMLRRHKSQAKSIETSYMPENQDYWKNNSLISRRITKQTLLTIRKKICDDVSTIL
jgi:hypothetical protein